MCAPTGGSALGAGIVHGIVVGDEERDNLVLVHGVHKEHFLEVDYLSALQHLKHGPHCVTLVLLALLYEDLVGALVVVGPKGIADPCLMTAGMLTGFVGHRILI